MKKIIEALDAVAGDLRAEAKAAGQGARGLLCNAVATQAALLAATVRGIDAGSSVIGVTAAPTDGGK